MSMYREGAKIEARQFRELALLAAVPKMNFDYFKDRIASYDRIIAPEVAVLPPKPGGPVIEAGSMEAQISMRSVAVNMRKFMGYGGR